MAKNWPVSLTSRYGPNYRAESAIGLMVGCVVGADPGGFPRFQETSQNFNTCLGMTGLKKWPKGTTSYNCYKIVSVRNQEQESVLVVSYFHSSRGSIK